MDKGGAGAKVAKVGGHVEKHTPLCKITLFIRPDLYCCSSLKKKITLGSVNVRCSIHGLNYTPLLTLSPLSLSPLSLSLSTHSSVPKQFRKDSVDRDSMKTREKYQKTQADRVRSCYKEGKAQALFFPCDECVFPPPKKRPFSHNLSFARRCCGVAGLCDAVQKKNL